MRGERFCKTRKSVVGNQDRHKTDTYRVEVRIPILLKNIPIGYNVILCQIFQCSNRNPVSLVHCFACIQIGCFSSFTSSLLHQKRTGNGSLALTAANRKRIARGGMQSVTSDVTVGVRVFVCVCVCVWWGVGGCVGGVQLIAVMPVL